MVLQRLGIGALFLSFDSRDDRRVRRVRENTLSLSRGG
jgi:hypothetical protein